ncbi:hypothetical protein VTO73DRAFT_7221 [Trametes versicolor]
MVQGLYWYLLHCERVAAQLGHQSFADKLKQRLPSADHPSADGQRYLEQYATVVIGYSQLSINDNHNFLNGQRVVPVATFTVLARKDFVCKDNGLVTQVIRNGSSILGVRTNDDALGPDRIVPLNPRTAVSPFLVVPSVLPASSRSPRAVLDRAKGHAEAA